jgi:hypothetical protein
LVFVVLPGGLDPLFGLHEALSYLLSALTPVDAFNHFVRLLPEKRPWHRFAHPSSRQETPDVLDLDLVY